MIFRSLFVFLTFSIIASQDVSAANDKKFVILELFTSEGCSSCPPADELLTQLDKNSNIMAFSFHVDYWDYLGWKDIFSESFSTQRQKVYANRLGAASLYTPQLVIQGQSELVGSKKREIIERIKSFNNDSWISVEAVPLVGNKFEIRLPQIKPIEAEVWVFGYIKNKDVYIKDGENRGKTLHHTNSVVDLISLGNWDGSQKNIVITQPKGDDFIILIQELNQGKILGGLSKK